MKKPTLKEWMKYAESNPYVFNTKTKLEFVKPRSITRKKMKVDPIVTIRVPMTKKEVTAYVGKPCKDHEVGCPTCDTWREWHLNYRYVSVQVDRAEMVALMIAGRL